MSKLRWLFCIPMALSMAACSSASGDPPGSEEPPPKFRETINPLLSKSCALTACHGSKQSNLGIYIPYEASELYPILLKESPTARGMKFVVPGDPDSSYLQIKIDGTQDQVADKCGGSCGQIMPLDLPELTESERDAVRAWIKGGAKND